MEGVKHREWAGALGQADPAKLQKTMRRGGVGMRDACELSRWLTARARGAGF